MRSTKKLILLAVCSLPALTTLGQVGGLNCFKIVTTRCGFNDTLGEQDCGGESYPEWVFYGEPKNECDFAGMSEAGKRTCDPDFQQVHQWKFTYTCVNEEIVIDDEIVQTCDSAAIFGDNCQG